MSNWLLFQMDLKTSSTLLEGTLYIMDGTKVVRKFKATSGITNNQDKDDQDARGVGPIPSCKKIGISSYSVNTAPFDRRNNKGIRGNFYYITPDPVTVDGKLRGEFGVHFDANVPGSAGCVVLRDKTEWNDFQKFMDGYQGGGFEQISLIVEYNNSASPAKPVSPTPSKNYLTVLNPSPGDTLAKGTSIRFSGKAESEVAKIIATIGPGGPYKIGDTIVPSAGTWSFDETFVTTGASRPLKFTAFDTNGDWLQDVDFNVTVS